MMADAARRNVDAGAQIIDINMGCPAKKVCNRLAGSALLQDEPLVARNFEAVVSAVSVPVTLRRAPAGTMRTRTAFASRRSPRTAAFRRSRFTAARVRTCIRGTPSTTPCVPSSRASRFPCLPTATSIRRCARARFLPSPDATAIMIGRAAQGRPWIFDEVNFFLRTGKLREELAREKVRDIMRAHLEDLYDFYGDETGVRVARKHLSWYFRQHPGQEALRDRLVRIETPQEQLATLLEQYDTRVAARHERT